MDDHRTISVSQVYVPNVYTLYLAPADRGQFATYEASLRTELASYLAEHARREGYTVPGRIRVLIESAEELPLGSFGISVAMQEAPRAAPGRQRRAPTDAATREAELPAEFMVGTDESSFAEDAPPVAPVAAVARRRRRSPTPAPSDVDASIEDSLAGTRRSRIPRRRRTTSPWRPSRRRGRGRAGRRRGRGPGGGRGARRRARRRPAGRPGGRHRARAAVGLPPPPARSAARPGSRPPPIPDPIPAASPSRCPIRRPQAAPAPDTWCSRSARPARRPRARGVGPHLARRPLRDRAARARARPQPRLRRRARRHQRLAPPRRARPPRRRLRAARPRLHERLPRQRPARARGARDGGRPPHPRHDHPQARAQAEAKPSGRAGPGRPAGRLRGAPVPGRLAHRPA